MKNQANRNYISNDVIMTPDYIASFLVNYFKPNGKILEPCKGTGNFLRVLPEDTLWCEITEGKDFFNFNEKVDWIITNPPWSKIRRFLQKSLDVSNNIVFLLTINHLWTRARLNDIFNNKFGIKEILIFDCKELNNSGFQLGAVYLKKYYNGNIKFKKVIIKK